MLAYRKILVMKSDEPELNIVLSPILKPNPKLTENKSNRKSETIRPATSYMDVKTRSALYANVQCPHC